MTPSSPACPRCEGSGIYSRLGETNRPCSICDGTGTMEAAVKNATEGTTPTRPPGNEIRVKCAEAMGWTRDPSRDYECIPVSATGVHRDSPVTRKIYIKDGRCCDESDLPPVDTSCDAAMELLRSLEGEYWWEISGRFDLAYGCIITSKNGKGKFSAQSNQSPAVAIATAFLATKGLEP